MSESSPCQAKALASFHGTLLNNGVPQQNMTEVQRYWPQINKTPVFDQGKTQVILHTNLWPLKRLGEGKFSSFHNVNQTCFLVRAELAIFSVWSAFPESGKWESSCTGLICNGVHQETLSLQSSVFRVCSVFPFAHLLPVVLIPLEQSLASESCTQSFPVCLD